MANEIVMPKLGQTMKEGTLVNIRVADGASVSKGDILFEIETDKATLEMAMQGHILMKAELVGLYQKGR